MTDLPNQLQLHPHSPDTLLPLLAAHLPYSLGVYGTLVSAPRGEHTVAWATFSSETVPIPRVSVSRSDASSSIGPGLEGAWTVIVPYAGSGSHQTRIYCSYEHPSSRSGRARGTHTSETNLDAAVKPPHESGAASEGAGSGQADDEDKERKEGIDRALQQVLAVFRAYSAQVDPDFRIAGCVHSLWAPALEDMWAVEVGERRGYCGAWLRRGDNSKRLLQGDRLVREEVQGADASEGIVGEQAKMEQINGALDGYEVRLGTENDVESVRPTFHTEFSPHMPATTAFKRYERALWARARAMPDLTEITVHRAHRYQAPSDLLYLPPLPQRCPHSPPSLCPLFSRSSRVWIV